MKQYPNMPVYNRTRHSLVPDLEEARQLAHELAGEHSDIYVVREDRRRPPQHRYRIALLHKPLWNGERDVSMHGPGDHF